MHAFRSSVPWWLEVAILAAGCVVPRSLRAQMSPSVALSSNVRTASNNGSVPPTSPAAAARAAYGGLSGKLLVHFGPDFELAATGLSAASGQITRLVLPWEGSDTVEIVQDRDAPPVATLAWRPFADKRGAYVDHYRVGYWPGERRRVKSEAYDNPDGFIEVTPENQNTRISEHFRLRDFLSKGNPDVWPKYVVLREPLIDKLELVAQDLARRGISTGGMGVLSGFRTPEYNLELGDRSGRSRNSRHQFGDAADVYIDSDGDGKMDDLNGDGRVNFSDTRVVLASVERVERAYPELVGGTGLYRGTGAHGPFAHIDVRGSYARWVRGVRAARSRRRAGVRPAKLGSRTAPAQRRTAKAKRRVAGARGE